MRILAIDWGEVRVGAAVSDEQGRIAFPLDQAIDGKKAVSEIQDLAAKLRIGKILVGYPKSLSGADSASSKKVLEFIEKLKKEIFVPIEQLDERFSSVAAGKVLTEQGLSEKRQRSIKDNIAAQLLLQQYLDTKNNP